MNPILPHMYSRSYYRDNNSDLAHLYDDDLINHYFSHGICEGRISNNLEDRLDFIQLVNTLGPCLEIGPFTNPLLKGRNIFYFDLLSSEELKVRAIEHGLPIDNLPPQIHYVLKNIELIPDKFDNIFSSHVIEHQPDFLSHLNSIEKRLSDNGRYFLCIPDKRYCFDHNLNESNISDILQAFHEKREVHTLKSVLEHRCLTSHNDPKKYWANPNLKIWPDKLSSESVLNAVNEFKLSEGSYIDVHAFYFTPSSFFKIMKLLLELNLTALKVERIYPTRLNNNEFWVILKKGVIVDQDPFLDRLVDKQLTF